MVDYLMNSYRRQDIGFVRGQGAWLYTADGDAYLDAVSGIAVCSLGHAHPQVAEALAQQASAVLHTSNLYRIPLQEQLGARLCQLSGMQKVFFCNSGAEANEAAIKLARMYGHQKGHDCPKIIVMEGAFHGRTLATLTATGNRKIQAGFEPLVEGFVRVPYGDAEAVANQASEDPAICAILVEPIQGEGGVVIPKPGYLRALRAICDERGWLLMLDEVQTGMCRTGRWFAYQHEDIVPDVMALAKSLGNGVPIGACLVSGVAADIFQPGNHGSTFGGNPLACRAGLAVIDAMESGHLVERAANAGAALLKLLRSGLDGLTGVREIRGLGLIIGIELDKPCAELVAKALVDENLLINVTADKVIRLLPPLITSDDDLRRVGESVIRLVRAYLE
jgi:acetylornithine aminotransferase